jgi:signal transduction histidine kinase
MGSSPTPDVGYIICDARCRILNSSHHAAELLGIHEADIQGCFLTDIFLPLIGSEEQIDAVIHGDIPSMAIEQINIRTRYDEMRYVSLTLFAHSTGIIAIVSDVTAHSLQQQFLQQQHHDLFLLHERVAEQNQQLNTLNEELTELSQRKSDMLAIATHDLRSPLVAIMGYVELLFEGEFDPLTDQQREAVGIIGQESQRMLNLIKTLLDLKRLESMRSHTRYSITLDKVLSQVIASFYNHARLAHITLGYDGVQGINPDETLVIFGDRDSLQQAIVNLVSNGIKYAGEGKRVDIHLIKLSIPLPALKVPLDPERLWCAVQVADNGPGMNETDLLRVFDPFFRTKDARSKNLTGSGLGLTIVQRAVQYHEGQIVVESTLGLGTTFTLYFPCVLVQASLASET